MAFNFFSGGYSAPRTTSLDQMYQDPRRQGSMGSFNPDALQFGNPFADLMKGGMAPPAQSGTKQPPPTQPPGAPQVPIYKQPGTSTPTGGAQSSTYYAQPGTPPPVSSSPPPTGTPVDKPGQTPAPGGSGAFNYSAYPTLEALYAAHPGGLPVGFDMQAWANATGNQAVMNQSTSGDPLQFTWNPDGPGYVNPMTGETYDRPGETYPYTPPPPPPYTFSGGAPARYNGMPAAFQNPYWR